MTPEERVRLSRMAAAEVIGPQAAHRAFYVDEFGGSRRQCSAGLAWRTLMVVEPAAVVQCWPCFAAREFPRGTPRENPCGHSPVTSPWPEVVR